METSLSNHPDQHHNGESSTRPPSTGDNPQSMVAIHYRRTTDNRRSSNKFEQAEKAISSASLGRIRMDYVGEESHRFQGSSRLAYGELPNFETVSKPHSSQEVRSSGNMPGGYSGDPEVLDSVETGLDGFHKPSKDNGMEHDGGSNNDA